MRPQRTWKVRQKVSPDVCDDERRSMHFELLIGAPRALAGLVRDNSNLSALALILSVVGGCMLSAWREQLRERRAHFTRRLEPLD